jgi:hypothetical protein
VTAHGGDLDSVSLQSKICRGQNETGRFSGVPVLASHLSIPLLPNYIIHS